MPCTRRLSLLIGKGVLRFLGRRANFHEKAHFVKADVVASFAVERYGCASFALCFHSHSL
jgi:hypothetical protein